MVSGNLPSKYQYLPFYTLITFNKDMSYSQFVSYCVMYGEYLKLLSASKCYRNRRQFFIAIDLRNNLACIAIQ